MNKATAIVRQVAVASFVAWLLSVVIGLLFMWLQDLTFANALARACFVVAIFTFGAGAAGVSGGVVPGRALSGSFRSWGPLKRDEGPRTEGPLTLLGLALFVVPQLVWAGVTLYS